MAEVLTMEALRRAVATLKAGYCPAPVDDFYAIYVRPAVGLMLQRSRTWWRITDHRAKTKAERRRVRRRLTTP